MIKILQWGLYVAFVVAVFIFVYSQIFLPLFRKTPLFPFFRRRPVIEREIEAVTEELREQKQREELKKSERKLRN